MKTSKYLGVNSLLVAVIFLAGVVHIPANADPVLSFNVGPLMDPMMIVDDEGELNGDGSYHFSGEASMMGMWMLTYDVSAIEDPVINAQIGFVNTSSVTQSFVIAASIPIFPQVLPSSLIGGSFGGSVTDLSGDGNAFVSTVGMGTPMYQGEIDGTGVLPIYPHSTSFSVASPYGTANIPAIQAGAPIPSLPGPAALSSIGITHKFTLTPGDSVSFTSVFVVEPIPEPATMGLLGLVTGGLYFARRFFIA